MTTIPAPSGADYYRAEVGHETIGRELLATGDEAAAELHFGRSFACNYRWTYGPGFVPELAR